MLKSGTATLTSRRSVPVDTSRHLISNSADDCWLPTILQIEAGRTLSPEVQTDAAYMKASIVATICAYLFRHTSGKMFFFIEKNGVDIMTRISSQIVLYVCMCVCMYAYSYV